MESKTRKMEGVGIAELKVPLIRIVFISYILQIHTL